jgi:hypothetical protein
MRLGTREITFVVMILYILVTALAFPLSTLVIFWLPHLLLQVMLTFRALPEHITHRDRL